MTHKTHSKKFHNAVHDYKNAKETLRYIDPYPGPKLCFHPANGYYTSVYFSNKYIVEVQGAEVLHG